MNEEEKIAFNFYKGCNENDLKRFDDFSEVTKKQIKYTETLLNLIEKQQKEIVRLQNIIKRDILQDLISIEKVNIYKNYVSKDKIKEKIEEITSYAYTSAEERDCQDYAIQVLKELLGE